MKVFGRILVIVLISSLFSCVKKTEETDTDTGSASENFLATSIANDMNNISDEAARTKGVSSFRMETENSVLGSCATLKFDTISGANVDTVTVNFGTTNCLCNDGRYRRGSLIITYSGKYRDSLTVINIVPLNYFVNDNGVTGSKSISNLGHNAQGHLIYDISENLVVTKSDKSGNIVYNAKRRREWVRGENTLIWADDIYSITGSASGTNANGRTFVSNITTPLVRDMSLGCRKHFVSGVIEHIPLNKPSRILDFGDGTCDDKATVTINSKTYTITLP